MQETLLALHLQRGTYNPSLPVSAWLYAIARHKLVDLLRRRGRTEALHDPIDELPEAMHPLAQSDGSARRDLDLLLDQLPAAQRHAIMDTKVEGLSVAETARRRDMSESAVKVNVHRELRRLAALMRGDTT